MKKSSESGDFCGVCGKIFKGGGGVETVGKKTVFVGGGGVEEVVVGEFPLTKMT
jgi:hypothetical protein